MDTGHIKSFVTETEIEERRKRRQEEWEKVRNSDEPESQQFMIMRCHFYLNYLTKKLLLVVTYNL